jgi:hypothetical protein
MTLYSEHKEPGYVCPRTGRVAVSVPAFVASDLNGDAAAYFYSQQAEDMNLDPWRMIEGIDAHINGESFEIWFADGGFKTVGPRTTIFVRKADAAQLIDLHHLV